MNNLDIKKLVYKNKVLKSSQINAIESIFKALKDGNNKIVWNLLPGSEKSIIIAEILKTLFDNKLVKKVLIIVEQKIIIEQCWEFYRNFYPDIFLSDEKDNLDHGILFALPSFINKNFDPNEYDVIITDDFSRNTSKKKFLEKILCSKAILFCFNKHSKDTYFANTTQVYTLKLNEIQQNIEFSEIDFINKFVNPLFRRIGFKNITYERQFRLKKLFCRPDIISYDKDGNVELLCEVKYYRDKTIAKGIFNAVIYQFLAYKSIVNAKNNILLLLSDIDKELKTLLYETYKIIVWDVSNLLFITQNYPDLYEILLDMINYPIDNIVLEKPFGYDEMFKNKKDFQLEKPKSQNFIKMLKECPYGKENKVDKIFENLCVDIIHYLFEGEFRKLKPQLPCADDLFRMDLLVGIKGSKEFWDLLIRHYNTRFIVFEFKNYEDKIKQNLIYTTEKYLYNVALRNVAIIISRKGFSENAKKAANGCLRENGKLILDLTENDLIAMLAGKEEGKEPSEYLYHKLEELLFSIGK